MWRSSVFTIGVSSRRDSRRERESTGRPDVTVRTQRIPGYRLNPKGITPPTAKERTRARVAKPGNGGGLKIRSRRGPRVQIPSLASHEAHDAPSKMQTEGLKQESRSATPSRPSFRGSNPFPRTVGPTAVPRKQCWKTRTERSSLANSCAPTQVVTRPAAHAKPAPVGSS